jgi:hypothetical protein
MFTAYRWRSRTALLMALGMSSAAGLPLLLSAPAAAQSAPYQVAQLFPQRPAQQPTQQPLTQVGIPAGTVIPVRYDEAEKIIVTPDETSPVTLTVAEDVRSSRGTVLIRAGSQIAGELRPDDEGTRFYSETITPPGSTRSLEINATSAAITNTETITRRSDPNILEGAAIGGAAAAVLAEIFGDIDILEVLGGAGLGTLASILLRGREEVEVVVINPATDLDLTLQSDFVLR